MTASGRPAYHQVADDLRAKIAGGSLAPGKQLPSTAQLMAEHGVSSTVAKAAINQLRAEGLVVGQPGKGVFVSKQPEPNGHADPARQDGAVAQLEEISHELRRVAERLASLATQLRGTTKGRTRGHP